MIDFTPLVNQVMQRLEGEYPRDHVTTALEHWYKSQLLALQEQGPTVPNSAEFWNTLDLLTHAESNQKSDLGEQGPEH